MLKLKMTPNTLASIKTQVQVVVNCIELLTRFEALAPINLASHGLLIDNMIESAREALKRAEAYKAEVAARPDSLNLTDKEA